MRGPSRSPAEPAEGEGLRLLGKMIGGFELHPFFFVLNTEADPPILPFAHQTELLFRLAFRRPVRVLVGDEIGLGKTIEAILVTRLLERRDNVRRVLLLVPRILVEQWKSELKRFRIRARVIERKDIDALDRRGFPEGCWYIGSIDLVKRGEHKPKVVDVDWDVIIVDEAHRVGRTGSSQRSITQRYELVEDLSRDPKRNVILLSATPHRGHARDYISRLKLIDPYLIGERELDDDSFYRLTRDSIVVRRTKIDVNGVYERRQVFKNARFVARVIGATQREREFNNLLFNFLRDKILRYYEFTGEEPKALPLLMALIAKRASSSPYAAMLTLERMLERRSLVMEGKAPTLGDASKLDVEAESIVEAYLGLGFEDYSDVDGLEEAGEPDEPVNRLAEECSSLLDEQDFETVKRLFELSESIVKHGDSRLKGVLALINEHLDKGDKIVVFTEYKDTADHVYRKLAEEVPGAANYAALITSDGITIPGWRGRERPDIEDLKRRLGDGRIKLIVSTDVASEGLNLQMANVVVNYEPTWSPIKVEQRLGRVWRLGQEREVTSYTIFLAIRSDRDVLDVLYKKLLAWGRALQEHRVPIGEEVVIDMLTEEGSVTIPIDVSKGTPRYTEYKAILTYIREGREGLEKYIQSIVSALASLRKNLERVGLARRNIAFKVERLLGEVLGDFRGEDVERALKELFKTLAGLRGLDIRAEGDRIFAGPFIVGSLYDAYASIKELLPDIGDLDRPVYLISSAPIGGLRELHLFEVTVFLGKRPVYSETVGVGVKAGSTELIRGKKLVNIVSQAASPEHLVASVQEYSMPEGLLRNHKVTASKNVLNKVVLAATDEYIEYASKLEELDFSNLHHEWHPRNLGEYGDRGEYIGAIIFAAPADTLARGSPVPPIRVEEVEKAAMRFALDYERKAGRVPEDVSMREHFDILSRNPNTGEIRFIEVKGRSGLDLEIELTETEFRVANEKGKEYWLYIVYGVGTGKPRLLAIRDPVNNMKWREVSVRRYRFRPG